MKSSLKVAPIIVLLILAGNKTSQSCSTNCTIFGLQKINATQTNTAFKHAEKLSLISIVYSPGINF